MGLQPRFRNRNGVRSPRRARFGTGTGSRAPLAPGHGRAARSSPMATPIDPGTRPEAGPASAAPRHIGFVPRPRLRWLSPGVLLRTGLQAATSSKLAEFIDRRESQAVLPVTTTDLSDTGEGWVDYVADCGDGFDAAATVASVLARPELTVSGHRTRAGSVLVMGGDQAYPYASVREYRDRLVGPYRSMLPWTPHPRRLYAIPGNHDWYDGLSSFLKQFCQGRWIGGWRTEQTRSYFALDLPGPWRLWAIDIALGTDIDAQQLEFFADRAADLDEGDAIILVSAKPSWTDAGPDHPDTYATLNFFERHVIGDRARLRVSLTGDTHHYARYEGPADQQKITAGGGGAYLSATHRLRPTLQLPPAESTDPGKSPPTSYTLAGQYPAAGTSRELRSRIVAGVYRSGLFWLLTALIYLVLALPGTRTVLALTGSGQLRAVPTLLTAGLLVGVTAALVAFARLSTARRRRATALGLGHTAVHVAVLTGAIVLAGAVPDLPGPWREAAGLTGAAVAGALLGPLVFALYLRIADLLGVNTNELFSAIAVQDHKCFLRLHIRPDDHLLTIYPVAVPHCARWRFAGARTDGTTRWFVPDVEPEPRLIEGPIEVAP
ncbi:MAG: metallophosphoesterase [Pseudonocardiaceae bacterium]|nr:metallophosphoesterase [Pseudonocardiaceae bacterium]